MILIMLTDKQNVGWPWVSLLLVTYRPSGLLLYYQQIDISVFTCASGEINSNQYYMNSIVLIGTIGLWTIEKEAG